MKKIALSTYSSEMLGDTWTPVSLYLKVRDHFREPLLLESSDYHGTDNSFSYLCFDPLASLEVRKGQIYTQLPGAEPTTTPAQPKGTLAQALADFAGRFKTESRSLPFVYNGLFGFTSFDAAQYFEDLDFSDGENADFTIPEMRYAVYRFVIAIDHFKNRVHLFQHALPGEDSRLDEVRTLLERRTFATYPFKALGAETSNLDDEAYRQLVQKGIDHCLRGDVFQIVLSRRFRQAFEGDEFNVYRSLRSVNPSPYLFYFDYGSYKIFGSSPEAQLVVKGDQATIYPIAGTFKRTGDDAADAELAKQLADDPKENSEHVMLVDLARNDLSRNGHSVEVEVFKEVQYYSHVIHLVSKVTGTLQEGTSTPQMAGDTFPAGTLSGAPKHRAMQLIHEYEHTLRGFYGGAIGFMGFDGDYNHAIMIRSFLSQNNQLVYQAGAGVVAKSVVENELQEVNNKVAALRTALDQAQRIA